MSTDNSLEESPPTPQFGLIDLVDAFTAFRHEYRNQSRESRVMQDSLRELVQRIDVIADGLAKQSSLAESNPIHPIQAQPNQQASSTASEQAARTFIEFDIQWTRAIDAALRHEEFLKKQREQAEQAFKEAIAALSWFRRKLLAPFLNRILKIHATDSNSAAISDGLSILLSRLRQVLNENQIERRDALGEPFEGEWMRSIGTVSDPQFPAGHVAFQISPAYIFQGRVLKFADVRVANNT